ncbi:MAG: phosphoserine phosphatase RsbU/P [Acidobacteriota bacterium]|jgi:serine phosphatase RsbU (regulator of sigma subunit)|nr:phosphoserine phosphatase RsbU/P [Acidobacteriota bacterium]
MSSVPPAIRLTVVQPNVPPAHVDAQGPTVTLGRATECTIPIKDRYLSRRHAEIVFENDGWIVRDCGSVNGTVVNGAKLTVDHVLRPGDRILLGDTEVVFDPPVDTTQSHLIALDDSSQAKSIVIPMREATNDSARAGVLAQLAIEFLEDRPMDELFDFILARVSELLQPSRVAIALLGTKDLTFGDVRMRRADEHDGSNDLFISRTLLKEVIDGRSVVSYVDGQPDEKFARAQSIIAQHIRSAVCAPLVIGDAVRGVLYLDFLAQRGAVTHDEVRLIAQIARLAAVKLETTRLREDAMTKAKLEEELRTARQIQSKLLPAQLPSTEQYVFAATNKPCRTVSGDYYDVITRPDGRIYFIIADVSGKGITAALIMSSLATAFDIFTRRDLSPAELVREMNVTLAPKTAPTKFATLVVGVLDPATGVVDFTNAGHVAPLVVSATGVEMLTTTDMVVGLFSHAQYRTQSVTLGLGDSLVLFTDGVTEAENALEEQLGLEPVCEVARTLHATPAGRILETIDECVLAFAGDVPASDDVTMLAVTRLMGPVEPVQTAEFRRAD